MKSTASASRVRSCAPTAKVRAGTSGCDSPGGIFTATQRASVADERAHARSVSRSARGSLAAHARAHWLAKNGLIRGSPIDVLVRLRFGLAAAADRRLRVPLIVSARQLRHRNAPW